MEGKITAEEFIIQFDCSKDEDLGKFPMVYMSTARAALRLQDAESYQRGVQDCIEKLKNEALYAPCIPAAVINICINELKPLLKPTV